MGMTIPVNVRSIGKGAFMNCTSLDSLVFLGDTIETIADSAFYNCANLAYIRLQDTIPPAIYEKTLYNVDRSIPIYVPINAAERYRQTPYWSEFGNFIEPSPATKLEEVSPCTSKSKNSDFNGKKLLDNNQLFILRDGKKYNLLGALVE